VLVSQFNVRESAATKIEHAMHAPIGAFAAGFADAGTVGETQRAARPTQSGAGRLGCQQQPNQGGEEGHRLLQPVMNARISEVRDLHQRYPTRCLAQRETAWTARQGKPQQTRAIAYLAFALDRLGLQRETIQVKVGREPLQQVGKLVRGDRCCALHLSPESSRFEPSQ
jgi:hypothetical protein